MAYAEIAAPYYEFDCPEGAWAARFIRKVEVGNFGLKLVFLNIVSEKYCALTAAWRDLESSGHDFRNDVAVDDIFVLITERSEDNLPILETARRILEGCSFTLGQSRTPNDGKISPRSSAQIVKLFT